MKWDIYKKIGWENQFQNLLLFKERYGHAQVPQRWSENKTLANWVSIQRRDKHKLSSDKKKLEEIGFLFKIFYKRGLLKPDEISGESLLKS